MRFEETLVKGLNIQKQITWFNALQYMYTEAKNKSLETSIDYAKLAYLYIKANFGYIDKNEVYKIFDELDWNINSVNPLLITNNIFSSYLFNEEKFPDFTGRVKRIGKLNLSPILNLLKEIKNIDFIKEQSFQDWFNTDEKFNHLIEVNINYINMIEVLSSLYKTSEEIKQKEVKKYFEIIKPSFLRGELDTEEKIKMAIKLLNYVEDKDLVNSISSSKKLKNMNVFLKVLPHLEKYISENKKYSEKIEIRISDIKGCSDVNVFEKDPALLMLNINMSAIVNKYNLNKTNVKKFLESFVSAIYANNISDIRNLINVKNSNNVQIVIQANSNKFEQIENEFEYVIKTILLTALNQKDLYCENVAENFENLKTKILMKKDVLKAEIKKNVKKF